MILALELPPPRVFVAVLSPQKATARELNGHHNGVVAVGHHLLNEAVRIRKEWMLAMGFDLDEVTASILNQPPLDIEKERMRLDAALQVAELPDLSIDDFSSFISKTS